MVRVSVGSTYTESGNKDNLKIYEKANKYEIRNGLLDIIDDDNNKIATFAHYVWVEICEQ